VKFKTKEQHIDGGDKNGDKNHMMRVGETLSSTAAHQSCGNTETHDESTEKHGKNTIFTCQNKQIDTIRQRHIS
jgi:hypothetical protein